MHASTLGRPPLPTGRLTSHRSTTSNTPKQPTPPLQGNPQEALRSAIPITPEKIKGELALTDLNVTQLHTPSSSNLVWVAMGSLLGFSMLPNATALTLTEIENLVSSLNTTSVAQTATSAAQMVQMMQIEGTLRSTQEEFLLFQQFTTILNLTANTAIEKLSVEIDRSKSLKSENTTLTIALIIAGFVILATAIIELRSYLSKCSPRNQNANGRIQSDPPLEEVVVHNAPPSKPESARASSLANTKNQHPLNVAPDNPLPISVEIVHTNSSSTRASSFEHVENHLQRDPWQLHTDIRFSSVAGIAGKQDSQFQNHLAYDVSSQGSSFESLEDPAEHPQKAPISGADLPTQGSHSPCFSPRFFSPTFSHISIVEVPVSDPGAGVNPNPLQTFQTSPRAEYPLSAHPPTRRRLDASLAPLSAADVQGRTDGKPTNGMYM